MASSSRAFDSADIEGRTRVECEPGFVGSDWACAVERLTKTSVASRRFLPQRRHGATKDIAELRCAVAPLREKFFINLPVSPNRLALLHERLHTFVCVLSLHQLVQIDVFLFAKCLFD